MTDAEGFLWHLGTYRPLETRPGEAPPGSLFAGTRYTDARGAITWLARASVPPAQLVVAGDGDAIAHAEFTIGDGLFMLGTGRL